MRRIRQAGVAMNAVLGAIAVVLAIVVPIVLAWRYFDAEIRDLRADLQLHVESPHGGSMTAPQIVGTVLGDAAAFGDFAGALRHHIALGRGQTYQFERRDDHEVELNAASHLDVGLQRGADTPDGWLSGNGGHVVIQEAGVYFLQAKTTFNQLDDRARARTQIIATRPGTSGELLRVSSRVYRSGSSMHPTTVGMVELAEGDRVQLRVDYDGPNFVRFANPTSLTLIRL